MTGNVLLTHIDEDSVKQLQRQAQNLGISPGEYVTRLMTLHVCAERLTRPETPPEIRAAITEGLQNAGIRWKRPGE